MVLDATSHHLGDRITADLDPPQAEGGVLQVPFHLESVPEGPVRLAVDIIQVVGVEGTPIYSDLVKLGQLRTRVQINGKPLDDLNTFVTTRNESQERVRIPIPAGLLQPGENLIRFEQTGTADDPQKRDNLGILGIALESPSVGSVSGTRRP